MGHDGRSIMLASASPPASTSSMHSEYMRASVAYCTAKGDSASSTRKAVAAV